MALSRDLSAHTQLRIGCFKDTKKKYLLRLTCKVIKWIFQFRFYIIELNTEVKRKRVECLWVYSISKIIHIRILHTNFMWSKLWPEYHLRFSIQWLSHRDSVTCLVSYLEYTCKTLTNTVLSVKSLASYCKDKLLTVIKNTTSWMLLKWLSAAFAKYII